MTPENPYTGLPEENYYTSFEDFAARSGGSVTLYTSADQVAVQVDYDWTGAKKTTLGGLEAWSNVGVFKQYDDRNWFQTAYQYWIPPMTAASTSPRAAMWQATNLRSTSPR